MINKLINKNNYTPNDSLNTIIRSYKIIYKIVR